MPESSYFNIVNMYYKMFITIITNKNRIYNINQYEINENFLIMFMFIGSNTHRGKAILLWNLRKKIRSFWWAEAAYKSSPEAKSQPKAQFHIIGYGRRHDQWFTTPAWKWKPMLMLTYFLLVQFARCRIVFGCY